MRCFIDGELEFEIAGLVFLRSLGFDAGAALLLIDLIGVLTVRIW
jgi:hypothetical protein